MGRRRRSIERCKGSTAQRRHTKNESGDRAATTHRQDTDEVEGGEEERAISLSEILAQWTGDEAYLRLKNLSGHLPLSLFTHPRFQHLRVLNLRGSHIRALPPQIIHLKHLRHLDISGNTGINLPAQLTKLSLTRFVHTIKEMDTQNYMVPYTTKLCKSYIGDRKYHKLQKLISMAAKSLIREEIESSPDDLDILEYVPRHLHDLLVPRVCAECGDLITVPVATRIKHGIVGFTSVPLTYTLCSPTCLSRIQEMWKLEDQLNAEKRALRALKFGSVPAAQYSTEYAYA